MDQLTVYRRAAAHILQQWDDYSDQHVDSQGWPLDPDAYGTRQRQRDADTWTAFTHLRPHQRDLLTTAHIQLAGIPHGDRRLHWPGHLTLLEQAVTGLADLQAAWVAERDALPARAVPGTEEYDEPLAERNAEAWGYLCDWATYSHTLNEIATAANDPASPGVRTTRPARKHPDAASPVKPARPRRPHR